MLMGASSSVIMATASSGGAYSGGALDTQTVTVGASGTIALENRQRGFILAALGGINDGTSNLYAGASIRRLVAEENTAGIFDVQFEAAGVQANSGWTSLNIGGSSILNRASATFSTAGGNTRWTWPNAGNLFGASGTKIVGFD